MIALVFDPETLSIWSSEYVNRYSHITIIIIIFLANFFSYTRVSWWFINGVLETTSLLKSIGLFSVWKPIIPWCGLDSPRSSSDFQLFKLLYQVYRDRSENNSYNWYHRNTERPCWDGIYLVGCVVTLVRVVGRVWLTCVPGRPRIQCHATETNIFLESLEVVLQGSNPPWTG